ncbi:MULTISPECIES: DUF742 domain-containing protein [Streptomyces]|uniref:DUF742 domain-containing protein n=1 Tax=Streptomyces TaxID=1883 RepID=UPI001884AE0D|nr:MULTISPECIES: DUF742 domain-containing protein [Streptomyces]MBF8172535.1 DUF742 domain-containing protein [Streptomyces olivaceus]MBZ6133165.1 DUF742 domain-containing protein [Streptomyces olivaceus]MBZ6251225.1 DUF742 domain-containing protein [Streptomyces olivaceus]MBZ6257482.1 DUF742 domain-containing protein [Streptomyces olivaceus]MCU8592190.1 DUF742 domain-containing protein [Streptomyces sp. A13(2022)]
MSPPKRQRRSPGQDRPAALPPSGPLGTPGPPGSPGKEGEIRNPERLFVIGGEGGGERADIDLVTLIVARADPPVSATPEQAALLRLCAAPLSVAELSAYLSLPFSVVTVLLTDLLATELVQARAPIVRQRVADRNLLEAVMHGLQKL